MPLAQYVFYRYQKPIIAPPNHFRETPEQYEHYLKKAKHSAPGPDGIPYAAWKVSGQYGKDTLMQLSGWVQEGMPPPKGFNDSLLAT